MKPGKTFNLIAMLVLLFGIIAYFGFYIYRSLTDVTEFTVAVTSTVDDRTEAVGFLVRDEMVIDNGSSSKMEVTVSDGEKVGKGGEIARIYSSSEAADRQREIDSLEAELSRLQTLQTNATSKDALTLDENIKTLMDTIHYNAAAADFTGLYDNGQDLKDYVFQRYYMDVDTDELAAEISDVGNQLAVLESRNTSSTRSVCASKTGTFSSIIDGYENLLTFDSVEDMSMAKLDEWKELSNQVQPDQYIGKLITSLTWYFCAEMDADAAKRMGDSVTVRFTGEFDTPIDMDVESISTEEDHKVAVVFSTLDYLIQTSELRYESADVIYDSITGLELPISALHAENETDDEGNMTISYGVYAVVGTRAEWKDVNVLYSDEEMCLVEATDPSSADALRSGDTVISKGKNIYDGKVVQE